MLNSKTEWKFFGSATGADSNIDYSPIIGNFTDLEVRVKLNLTSSSAGIFIFPIRTEMEGFFIQGYYESSGYSGSIAVHHRGTLLSLSDNWTRINVGSDQQSLTDAVVEVWYK